MFKNIEQVEAFVEYLEGFIKAVVSTHPQLSEDHQIDGVILHKKREALKAFITSASGITTASDTTDTLICPDCGGDMVLRTNREKGTKFWGCKKYPNCRGTRDENGLSREEREEQKYKKEVAPQGAGFSFNRDKRNVVTEVSPPVQDTGWINPFAKK